MKICIPATLAAAVLASSLSAQNIILREDFTNAVPPAGWSQVKHNAAAQGWILSANQRAWHEDEPTGVGATDDELIAPMLNLSGYSQVIASFQTELNWATYLANHPQSLGDGENDLYIRINGGAWVEVWTDTRLANTNDLITVDLSSYVAGQSNVEVAFRFYGTFAQEMWVDWFQLDDGGSGSVLTLAKTGTCPGPMTLTVTNATAGGTVVLFYGQAGNFTQNNPNRPCQGTSLGINNPTVGRVLTANGSGTVNFSPNMPPAACGLTVQGVDLSSCQATNSITL